ncbi:Crp/Fnr family transcriptional regulator [Pelosinus propionicus]|uniref:CRP/FNR family transcriptional regulator, anaerobic regulatory protein n=1 Tax=Pelosinus propionicus DSM 13327 TaxID=1123291 RepID=A0A1I4J0N5_9FIRM|nr:Crp/Fnr family transcriptional regulator [Pelosinus propionicus]SFL60135.1 CRP/FNR family transcriptional regulator, anaerobic regulatory protein [Pelosinus propionicus DSM 13327]
MSIVESDKEGWEYLREIPVFSKLPENQLEIIHNHTIERRFRKGMIVFHEGDAGEGFHYVKSGKVKVLRTSDDGREHIIKILGAGEIFAEVLMFNNQPYPATAVAVEPSCIGIIRNVDLEQLVLTNNELALQLIKALSQRLIYAQQKIKNLALNDVMSRTIEVLLRLSQEQGDIKDNGIIELALDLSRQDLANLVGTTRETVTRTLSSLKKDKYIDFDGQKIKILDVGYLRRVIS